MTINIDLIQSVTLLILSLSIILISVRCRQIIGTIKRLREDIRHTKDRHYSTLKTLDLIGRELGIKFEKEGIPTKLLKWKELINFLGLEWKEDLTCEWKKKTK